MKKSKDAVSTAALEIVAFEQRQDQLAELTKGAKEKAVSVLFREAGRIDAMNYQRAQAEFFMLVMLKRVKDAKEYREKLDMTWPQFCDSVGVKWRTIDDKLADLKPFKADFLTAFVNFSGFELNKIKYLGESVINGSAKISGNAIIYDGQEIAISPENKDEIQSVLDRIETKYKTDLDNAQANAGAQRKQINSLKDLTVKQEKDLRKFEKRAEGKGLSPEEDAFDQQIENFQTQFSGYMSRIQPDKIEELNTEGTVTPQMRARYLTLLEWMFMQVKAARDTAEERFGADLKESDWKK